MVDFCARSRLWVRVNLPGRSTRSPILVGDIVADKYEVTAILGAGGMGVVVAARHRELDQLVALKFMHEDLASNPEAIERFLREARAAACLNSEHVGRVLDVGRLASGAPFIVMEYLTGADLATIVAREGPLAIDVAIDYVLQACAAMAEAHARGIVHRDLKPQNLFLATYPDGRRIVKVLDFGISKAAFAPVATSTQQAMGTPAYMAPEQIRSSRSVDARADIWSLGVILYQLLTGSLPFDGDTIPAVIYSVLSARPAPLRQICREATSALEAVVTRCLEKEREHRYPTLDALVVDLRAHAHGHRSPPPEARRVESSRSVPAPAPTTLGTAAGSRATGLQASPPARRARALLAVALVGGGVFALAIRGRARTPQVVRSELRATAPVDAAVDAKLDASLAGDVDARVTTVDAPRLAPVDARRATPPPRAPRIDAAALEPARAEDPPLEPAKEDAP